MKNILTILSLFISVNFYSQIIHPQDGTNIKELFCDQSVPYFDPGGQQGNYSPNVMSEQQFIVPSGGHVIQIDFNNLFDVKSDGTGGCEDYIEVYDGAIGGGGTLIGIYCNINPPGIITSTGNAITVKFYSDGSNNFQGWVATVTAVDILSPQGSDPGPISVQCIGDVPPADVSVVTDESDNCGSTSVSFISDQSDGNHCPETITRTYRINDVIGNFIDVYQTITIHDVTAPVMVSAPADTVIACKSDMPVITNLSYDDNCDGDGMVSGSDVSNGNTCPEIVTRTWTYTDAC
ncbi:MAG: CUB domain-containing protein, partial [Flavobacteriales bacterium]|nr:CUB domain-containing protein [Flavobacteriales bacterium]